MKIALVSPYDYPYPGGVTSHIAHLDEEFTRMGHLVTILAPSSTNERDLAHTRVVKLGSVVPVPANGSVARITLSLRLSGRVKRLLASERFDVIHVHEPFMPALPMTVLRHSSSINVGTFHCSWDGRVPRIYSNPVTRRLSRRLHVRVAVSSRAREFIADHFPGDYTVIPNGIAIDEFGDSVRPFEHLRDGKLNILFVGRLEQRKGFRYLLRAYARLRASRDDIRLVVVGAYDDKARRRYEAFVHSAGIGDVQFVGRASSEDLPRFYRSCDIFCAPSTGGESQGVVLLEAMASGRPIVASNIGGYSGVMTHAREGLLVPPKDVDSLAAAIETLLADPDLRARMSAAGPIRAADYSWPKIAARLIDLYDATRQSFPAPMPGRHGRRPMARYLRRLGGLFVATATA